MLSNPSEEEKQFEKITAAALLGTMPVGILVFDDQYNVTYLNSCFSNFGVLQPQFLVNPIGKNLKDEQLFLSGDISKDIQSLRDQFFFEKELGNQKTSDGGEISIILKGVALLEGETFLGGMLVVEDLRIIGDARNTNLPIQNENYSDIFQNLNNLLILTDIDGNVSYAFGNLLKTLFRKNLPNGKAGKNFLHHPIHEIFPTESLDKLEKLLKEIKETKKKSSFITSLRFEEEELVFDIQIFPVLTSRKEVQFVCFYFEDITVYIKEQEYLKQQIDELQFYEMITQKATDAMLVLNASGQIVFWNKTAENLTGYSKSEVYNKPFEKFFLSFDH
ncbi:MAG: PAS domain-containing protein, partial [Ignavibacteriaceae bacterium]